MTSLPSTGAMSSNRAFAVAAENIMESVPTYIALETGSTVLQFVIVGPLMALAYRR